MNRPIMNMTSPILVTRNAFLAARGRGGPLEPEPDEQVGAETDQLPEDEQLEEVVRQDQAEHDADEQAISR